VGWLLCPGLYRNLKLFTLTRGSVVELMAWKILVFDQPLIVSSCI